MTSRRRPFIERKKRFFLGCEGESERAYGSLIQRISEDKSLRIFLDMPILNGGNPRSIIEQAIKQAEKHSSKRGAFFGKAVLLDTDTLIESPKGTRQKLEMLAQSHNMLLIWQDPCHEAFLLRHLVGGESLRPGNSRIAINTLRRRWPAYERPMHVASLYNRIGYTDLLRATSVEPILKDFLTLLGLYSVQV